MDVAIPAAIPTQFAEEALAEKAVEPIVEQVYPVVEPVYPVEQVEEVQRVQFRQSEDQVLYVMSIFYDRQTN